MAYQRRPSFADSACFAIKGLAGDLQQTFEAEVEHGVEYAKEQGNESSHGDHHNRVAGGRFLVRPSHFAGLFENLLNVGKAFFD